MNGPSMVRVHLRKGRDLRQSFVSPFSALTLLAARLRAWAILLVVLTSVLPANAVEQGSLEIVSKNGVHVFAVEIVANDADRAQGLMFRKELPQGRGMLFDFQREQNVAMWMKNTYIPLDMIFIAGDGRIIRIAENTEPLSEKIIVSGGPVRGVLEVIGGTARKLGIGPGDRVAHPIFAGAKPGR